MTQFVLNNVGLIAVVIITVVVLIGIIIMLLQHMTVKQVVDGAGEGAVRILAETNNNQALLDSIEGNKTSVPAFAYLWLAQFSSTAIRMALLVDPNSPQAGKAGEVLDQLDQFAKNISDGKMPTLEQGGGGSPNAAPVMFYPPSKPPQ